MASIRLLKKDINYLTSELIMQAYTNQLLFDKSDDELEKSVTQALDFRTDLYERLKPSLDKNDKKAIRKHYSKLREDMLANFKSLYETGDTQ